MLLHICLLKLYIFLESLSKQMWTLHFEVNFTLKCKLIRCKKAHVSLLFIRRTRRDRVLVWSCGLKTKKIRVDPESHDHAFKDEKNSSTTIQKVNLRGPQADRVWKFGQDRLPKETVRISQLYEAKSLNELIKVKCLFIYLKFDIYLDLIYW